MLLLGLDIGTSSIKASVVDASSGQTVASAQYPDTETAIRSLRPGWAEQSPEDWWTHTQGAILRLREQTDLSAVGAIGIAYQMHGLVLVDESGNVLRDSIIWCDSRAVPYGDSAFEAIGGARCLERLLNSPGNFTAAKLAWVKEAEPETFRKIHKAMLPGDFIALRLTGSVTTSVSALSEGVFWDFRSDALSQDVLNHFGYEASLIPEVQPLFSEHGGLLSEVAGRLGLKPGIPVTYKSGDQPNNALSLNVLQPGEVAATAGTSGVIYGVTDQLFHDPQSRVNTFAHVNYSGDQKRLGVLLCINGCGILNRWTRDRLCADQSYADMNRQAASVPPGSGGIRVYPFGNGAERMLGNRMPGAQIQGLDLNTHTNAHLYRGVQEGIAFAFRYGLDIMREGGMNPSVIRAGRANMFLSPVFTEAFVNATGVPVELYASDGSVGAAIGAGIGLGVFTEENAFSNNSPLQLVEPTQSSAYDALYEDWRKGLEAQLSPK
ncbi:MAG TPA: FGGY family carbohydrate kinase [Chitinophagaceae bacterium]|jgi:xylulokinase|nr:FGGY family carbohydrate kinase [Chitinophagaceae bacterium]